MMNIVTGKHITRRTLLRGAGAAVALPWLDAMRPALASTPKAVGRVGVVYVPNGIIMNQWLPSKTGADFEFARVMKPLERFRDDIVVVSGLSNHAANRGKGGGHAKASGSFLSASQPKYTAGADGDLTSQGRSAGRTYDPQSGGAIVRRPGRHGAGPSRGGDSASVRDALGPTDRQNGRLNALAAQDPRA